MRGQMTEDSGRKLAQSPATVLPDDRGQLLAAGLAPASPAGCHRLLVSQCFSQSPRVTQHRTTDNPSHPARHTRRGITLLEVLVSIGVVAVGLLGVATLIPLGSFAVNETAKADRSSALGRAAMHEVRVRDMLERMRTPTQAKWHIAKLGYALDDSPGPQLALRRTFLIGQAFAIDPLFATMAATTSSTGNYECFPFKTNGPISTNDSNLLRLKLNIFEPAANTPPLQLPVLERIFTWRDDLIFDLDEDDPDRRPRQSSLWSNGAVAAYPILPDDTDYPTLSSETALLSQAENNYSWMLTVEPDPSELPSNATAAQLVAHRQKSYTVSIATFYKRDFLCDPGADPPSERSVIIQFKSTGIGGGDAILGLDLPSAEPEEYLKLRENQWIMVSGFVRDIRLDPIFGAGIGMRRIAKWYRVIRVDDEVQPVSFGPREPKIPARRITLAGPDWDTKDTVLYRTARATLIEGAIGVYTTTVTLD